jgi:N-acetylneuraminic acid mutarotase
MRLIGITAIVGILMAGCGGGGGGSSSSGPAPEISGLSIASKGAYLNSGSGTATVSGQLGFSAPASPLASITIKVVDSNHHEVSSVTAPLTGAGSGTSGMISGDAIVSTKTAGDFEIAVYVTATDGQQSNQLVAPFRIASYPWSALPAMLMPRGEAPVVAVGSQLYVLGGSKTGSGNTGPETQSVEIYDAAANSWTEGPMLPVPMWGIQAAAVGTSIYVVSAYTTGPVLVGNVYVLDTTTGAWSVKSAIPNAVAFPTTVALNDKIYAMGGCGNNDVPSSAVRVYDPATDTWGMAASLPEPACTFGASAIDGKIDAFGLDLAGQTIEYDPASDSWTVLSTSGVGSPDLLGMGTASVGGLMYSIGGATQTLEPASKDAAFDPATKTWSQKEAPQGLPNTGSNSAVSYNGQIYLFTEAGAAVYNPANDLN